jgi:hypothetical protein
MATRISTGVGLAFLLIFALIVVERLAFQRAIYVREVGGQLLVIRSNIQYLDGAKDQWALEQGKLPGVPVNWPDLANYLKDGTIRPISGEVYTINRLGSNATAQLSAKLGTYAAGSVITAP